jgi:hypothetical protein
MNKIFQGVLALVLSLGISGAVLAAEPVATGKKAAATKADAAMPMYWDKWDKGTAKGMVPPCGVNVLPLGGDDILQATVDTYCAVKPGKYVSYINPAVMKIYKAKGNKYPDGKTGVLEFKEIGVAFTTNHKDGLPIYDVIALKDGKSVASKEKGHPLNPQVCADCHIGFKGVCVGFVCGNR